MKHWIGVCHTSGQRKYIKYDNLWVYDHSGYADRCICKSDGYLKAHLHHATSRMRLSFWPMKTTADATISVDQLTAKFKMWQLYTQLLEYIHQGKNCIRLVASCRWAFMCACKNWWWSAMLLGCFYWNCTFALYKQNYFFKSILFISLNLWTGLHNIFEK